MPNLIVLEHSLSSRERENFDQRDKELDLLLFRNVCIVIVFNNWIENKKIENNKKCAQMNDKSKKE